MLTELEEQGFVLQRAAIDEFSRERLLAACKPEGLARSVKHQSGSTYAARGLLEDVPGLASLLEESGASHLARCALGERAFPIDALFFDKWPDANWAVPGHQDRLMPVADPAPPGARLRHGIPCVQPSAEVLATLVALRIHFDPCDLDSGPLQLVPGSHRVGVLPDRELSQVGLDRYQTCTASPGDVLVMRPLLLHRSQASRSASRRRVLHVVYAPTQPREAYQWRALPA
ncbi:MAG: phytanoyl-CoA dioxygenase family protein [Polyangiaceae bacterium]